MTDASVVYAEPENEAFVNGTRRRIKGVSFIKVLFTSFLRLFHGYGGVCERLKAQVFCNRRYL